MHLTPEDLFPFAIDDETLNSLYLLSYKIKKDILTMIFKANSGHPGGSLSSADLLLSIYSIFLENEQSSVNKINNKNPKNKKVNEIVINKVDENKIDENKKNLHQVPKILTSQNYSLEKNICILSKGHAAPALYSILAHMGYYDHRLLEDFRKFKSPLQGHPKKGVLPGIFLSTGSLGQGAAMAVGAAIALKIEEKIRNRISTESITKAKISNNYINKKKVKKKKKEKRRVFAVLGDGECEEGIIWEAAMIASHNHLDNLIFIIDRNSLQLDGTTESLTALESLVLKWKAFNWHVIEIDGTSLPMILDAIYTAQLLRGQPVAIIAYTAKGQGVPLMEYLKEFHGKPPNEQEYKQALSDLKKIYSKWLNFKENTIPFYRKENLINSIKNNIIQHQNTDFKNNKHKSTTTIYKNPINNQIIQKKIDMDINFPLELSHKSLRDAFGDSLIREGEKNNKLIVIDADLSSSTRTIKFNQRFPERFINVGIAEQAMLAISAGIAGTGFIPVVSGFAVFTVGRGWEIIRSIAYDNLPVKICPTHSGLSSGKDGGSHQMLEDISLIASLPNMYIFTPCDPLELELILPEIFNLNHPVYVRLMRNTLPWVWKQEILPSRNKFIKDGIIKITNYTIIDTLDDIFDDTFDYTINDTIDDTINDTIDDTFNDTINDNINNTIHEISYKKNNKIPKNGRFEKEISFRMLNNREETYPKIIIKKTFSIAIAGIGSMSCFLPKILETLKERINEIRFNNKNKEVYSTSQKESLKSIDNNKNFEFDLYHVSRIKPIPETKLEYLRKRYDLLIFIEEHNIINGVGSIFTRWLNENVPCIKKQILTIGIEDRFGQTGSEKELYEEYKLTPKKIVNKIISFIEKCYIVISDKYFTR